MTEADRDFLNGFGEAASLIDPEKYGETMKEWNKNYTKEHTIPEALRDMALYPAMQHLYRGQLAGALSAFGL